MGVSWQAASRVAPRGAQLVSGPGRLAAGTGSDRKFSTAVSFFLSRDVRESGDVVAAEAAYRRAIDLDHEMAEWHLFLGHTLARQGRMHEAREAFMRFERLDPSGLERKRDELIALGLPEETVTSFWRSLTGNPDSR